MNYSRRKATGKIRTRTSMAHEAQTPHNKFFNLASLELKRMLCQRVRTTATERVAEMDRRLAEIERQEAELLQSVDTERRDRAGGSEALPATGEADPPGRRRFTLKY